jgi:hypothetical protein
MQTSNREIAASRKSSIERTAFTGPPNLQWSFAMVFDLNRPKLRMDNSATRK